MRERERDSNRVVVVSACVYQYNYPPDSSHPIDNSQLVIQNDFHAKNV